MPELKSFEDLAKASDRDLQRTMRHVEQKMVVAALKGCSAETRDKILGNFSERARVSISNELQSVSPSAAEIEEAQRVVVQAFDPA